MGSCCLQGPLHSSQIPFQLWAAQASGRLGSDPAGEHDLFGAPYLWYLSVSQTKQGLEEKVYFSQGKTLTLFI